MTARLTKIIATLGPASGSKAVIKSLVAKGVNIFRLNLSHGEHETVRQWIHWIREVENERHTYTGILLDLQGPKIRIGKLDKGSVKLKRGQRVVFTTEKKLEDSSHIHVQYSSFHKEVDVGNRIYLDDGKLSGVVKAVSGQRVEVEVMVGGILSDNKGLNLPDALLSADPITAKDKADLKFGLQEGVDMVALSFTGSAKDVRRLRSLIKKEGGKGVEVIAKIERKQAVENLEEIVQAADGTMVARGDLGIEIPLTEVPVVQQKILRQGAKHAKPVIVATQMLESMIENPRPTRAEVSDVAGAVKDCADAIMLSGETAVGRHATAAVEVMVEAALTTESYMASTRSIEPWNRFFQGDPGINEGITYSANRMVELLHARAMVVFTVSGGTAKMVACPKPMVPIFTFTSSVQRARLLNLVRGAVPFVVEEDRHLLLHMDQMIPMLKNKRLVKKGDRVVITTGIPVGIPNWTNVIRVEEVG
ncbi:MAG: pyruvate kinase [Nitrospinae bacterium]|nr:pyruvate kinase [Nitrospinota bacterium]